MNTKQISLHKAKKQSINFKQILVATLTLVALTACMPSNQAPISSGEDSSSADKFASVQVNENNIKAHLEFLADDALMGRDTGSVGYQVAANYVKSYFKQLGLAPLGGEGRFEQQINFRKTSMVEGSAKVIIHTSSGEQALVYPDQFLMSGSSIRTDTAVTAETVFVGYGIVSSAFDLDDYRGLDVKGKIVVALRGRHDDLPSEEGAHISSAREKRRYASERGAIGFITLHSPKREKVRSFEKSAKHANRPTFRWLNSEGHPFGEQAQVISSAYVHHQSSPLLFEGAKRPLDDIFSDDESNVAISGFPLAATVTLANNSRHQQITSPNVIAVIEGSDPLLKNEYVVFSAHLDHIGVDAHGDEPDKVNNGALDNASGVAILMETARLLSEMPEKPKRSVMFVVLTAEEKGLLGSSYFANNPTVPAEQIVANVNLDMPLILYPFADVIAFGATHSTLGAVVESAVKKMGISLSEDPMPEEAIFTRSDHYNFVKVGIPAIYLITGFESKDPSIDGDKVSADFLSTHYHQPSDAIDLPINYDAAATFAKVNMMIGLEIANNIKRPQWLPGDFFGNIFGG